MIDNNYSETYDLTVFVPSIDISVFVSYRARTNPEYIIDWWIRVGQNIPNKEWAKIVFDGIKRNDTAVQEIHDECLAHFRKLCEESATNNLPKPKPSCATCEFGEVTQHKTVYAKCLRYPPILRDRKATNLPVVEFSEWGNNKNVWPSIPFDVSMLETFWPLVASTDWCGEFKERKTDD